MFLIKTGINLSMGEKIRQIRQAKDLRQVRLAEMLSMTRARLSQLELGEEAGYGDINPDTLMLIKKVLGIEEMPLNETERMSFKDKLIKWNDVIATHNFAEAKQMRERLSVITFAPFDEELNTFFSFIDCRLELSLGRPSMAEKILDTIASKYNDDLSPELFYHYYRNKGEVCALRQQYHDALVFMTKAFGLRSNVKQDIGLYYSMALRCYNVGYLRRSNMFLEEALKLCASEQDKTWERDIYHALIKNYIGLKELSDADKLLEKLYNEANNTGDRQFLCGVLLDYGYMCRVGEDYSNCHSYLNEAMKHADKISDCYLEILYQKIRCYIAEGGVTVCQDMLKEGKRLSKGNRHYTILFESLGHLTTLKEDESIEYLETVTVPHLLNEVPKYAAALDYCEFLQKHYEQKHIGTIKKALEMETQITNILKRMYEKGELK